jgi:hypothetical protein
MDGNGCFGLVEILTNHSHKVGENVCLLILGN